MIARALATWFALLLLAIANGAFRQGILAPRLDAPLPHQISTVMLCVAIFVLAYFTITWINPATPRDAMMVGAMWLVLTLLFEFGFGRMRGMTWTQLLEDYNVLAGRIWPAVLMVTFLAPLIAGRTRGVFDGR
jgi:hypothetical protein